MTALQSLNERLAQKPAARLEVKNLCVAYGTFRGPFNAIDNVSFTVEPGTTLGLVGESGCGKSTVVKAIMNLLPEATTVTGEVLLNGQNILGLSDKALEKVRWTQISLITQSAMNSLDPVLCIGDQIVESILAHEKIPYSLAWARAEEMFTVVGLPAARLREFPHQFSGGMRQRAVIAMALSLNAGMLLADEPTTALDPIMQDQIMTRIRGIHEHLRRSMILVTHDIAVVSETCETTAVMYAGKLVESGATADVLQRPRHPYTMGLQNAFPKLPVRGAPRQPLISIPGTVPNLLMPPPGCRFASRCPFATELCHAVQPELIQSPDGHAVACHFAERAPEFRLAAQQAETWRAKEAAI
ncbi:ABC transporter ATP-binding protein [Devosia sp. A449]